MADLNHTLINAGRFSGSFTNYNVFDSANERSLMRIRVSSADTLRLDHDAFYYIDGDNTVFSINGVDDSGNEVSPPLANSGGVDFVVSGEVTQGLPRGIPDDVKIMTRIQITNTTYEEFIIRYHPALDFTREERLNSIIYPPTIAQFELNDIPIGAQHTTDRYDIFKYINTRPNKYRCLINWSRVSNAGGTSFTGNAQILTSIGPLQTEGVVTTINGIPVDRWVGHGTGGLDIVQTAPNTWETVGGRSVIWDTDGGNFSIGTGLNSTYKVTWKKYADGRMEISGYRYPLSEFTPIAGRGVEGDGGGAPVRQNKTNYVLPVTITLPIAIVNGGEIPSTSITDENIDTADINTRLVFHTVSSLYNISNTAFSCDIFRMADFRTRVREITTYFGSVDRYDPEFDADGNIIPGRYVSVGSIGATVFDSASVGGRINDGLSIGVSTDHEDRSVVMLNVFEAQPFTDRVDRSKIFLNWSIQTRWN